MNYKADKGRKWSFMSDTFIISWINHKKETINKNLEDALFRHPLHY